MRPFAINALMPLAIVACNAKRPSPLAAIGEVTRAQVTVFSREASTSMTVTDSATLARLRSLATAQGDWKSSWHTAPAGQIRAALYRDTAFIGVVTIGPNFIGARSASAEQFRPIAPIEEPVVASLRALK